MAAVDIMTFPLAVLGQLALQAGRLQEAYDLMSESLAAARSAGSHTPFDAWAAIRLGTVQLYQGELNAAERTLSEALLTFDEGKNAVGTQEIRAILCELALVGGDLSAAKAHLQASLEDCRLFYRQLQGTDRLQGTPDALPIDLIALCARAALFEAAHGNSERAITLSSIAENLRLQSQQVMIPQLQARLDDAINGLRGQLPEGAFESAWAAGRTASLAEAFAFLLE
jgi:hypothetical protein